MSDVIEAKAKEDGPGRPVEDDGGFDYLPSKEQEPAPVPAVIAQGNQAVAAMADAVLAMPGVAGRDEFLSIAMQARMLSLSGAAPPMIRNNPYVAFHVAMVGRDLGLSPTAAMELIDILDSRNGPQLSLSPQLMNAQAHRVYGGEIVKAYSQVDSCTAVAIGPGGRDPRCRRAWPTYGTRGVDPLHVSDDCACDVVGESVFTWEDAQMAGLAGPSCQPGVHVKDQTRRGRGGDTYKVCGCNQGYITYPKRMMWQRSCGFAADDYFPGAGLGLYTPEALGSMVDEDGRPIDPATVDLPEGYETAERRDTAEEPADPDDLWVLQVKLHALPEEQQQAWREQKMKQERLRGRPTHSLSAAGYRIATAMVAGLMSAARRKGWNEEEACEEISRLIGLKLISFLTLSPPEGEEPEPGTPDPGPESPDPETAPDSGDAPLQERPESGEAAKPAPTGADAAALTAQIGQSVDGMSTADVRTALRDDFNLPDSGGARAVRDRLIHAMVAAELETEEPF